MQQYITPLAVVMRTLHKVNAKLTYGEVAQIIGLYNPAEHMFRNVEMNHLINLTAAEHPDISWEHMVNAQTGKPGRGINRLALT